MEPPQQQPERGQALPESDAQHARLFWVAANTGLSFAEARQVFGELIELCLLAPDGQVTPGALARFNINL